ncbi:MAG: YihY/virulence factor BrkB family protein [Alistipes sp.]
MIKRLYTLFIEKPFRHPVSDYVNPLARLGVRIYRLLYYTIRELIEHETPVRTAALTFYTLISIVPILALVFAVLQAMGMIDGLLDDLYGLFPQNPEIIDYAVDFAEKALAHTRGGIMATVSIIMLFWAVIRVFSSIESAFNNIWEVNSVRRAARQWALYIGIVLIVPVLWVVAGTFSSHLKEAIDFQDNIFYQFVAQALSVVMMWTTFTVIYKFIPNTPVHFWSALTAGIAAGTTFLLFQWGYVYLQRWMSSYSAIYGSFAALPLFLLWVQSSWQILLFGGELAFAHQHSKLFDDQRRAEILHPRRYHKPINRL